MNPNPLLALNHFTVPCSLTDVLTFLLSYLCFSTASSRKAKEAASWNLQPLQTNLKVLQEQQTQAKHSMVWPSPLVNSPLRGRAWIEEILLQVNRASEAARTERKRRKTPRSQTENGAPDNRKERRTLLRSEECGTHSVYLRPEGRSCVTAHG